MLRRGVKVQAGVREKRPSVHPSIRSSSHEAEGRLTKQIRDAMAK